MEKHKEKGILVVVSGFSGAGKGTIMKNLTQKYDRIRPLCGREGLLRHHGGNQVG